MQFQLRVDDDNYVTFALQLQRTVGASADDGPELIAATITDSKLSELSENDIYGLAEQLVDYLSRDQSPQDSPKDWFRDSWLPATAAHEKR